MNLDPAIIVTGLRWLVFALYAPMLPAVILLVWLENRHPALYRQLPVWLK